MSLILFAGLSLQALAGLILVATLFSWRDALLVALVPFIIVNLGEQWLSVVAK